MLCKNLNVTVFHSLFKLAGSSLFWEKAYFDGICLLPQLSCRSIEHQCGTDVSGEIDQQSLSQLQFQQSLRHHARYKLANCVLRMI
jgi:hypothetical protein